MEGEGGWGKPRGGGRGREVDCKTYNSSHSPIKSSTIIADFGQKNAI